MPRKVKEEILASTHKDMILLIKEYARKGYGQIQGSVHDEFESFWRETFHLTESESVIPRKRLYPRVPVVGHLQH
jgi:hypothetical protein